MKKNKIPVKFFRRPLKCSLSLLIGLVFCSLLVALGLIITLYSYEIQKQRKLVSTEAIFDLSSKHTEETLSTLIGSVKSFVTTSSELNSLGVGEVDTMTVLMPYFKQSFINIPWMESFYVGYADGLFYMVHSIQNNEQITKDNFAPERAAYSLKMIPAATNEERQIRFWFFDSELNLLSTKTQEFDGYDPRKQDWYKKAISTEDDVVTEPYLFFSSHKVGITVADSLPDGAGVVGADSVLSSLADLLKTLKITPSTQIVLHDARGRVLLSGDQADLGKLQKRRTADRNGELFVKELENPAINVLYRSGFVNDDLRGGKVIEVEGKQWFGHVRKLLSEKNGGIYIAIAAPFKELMADAQATRYRSFLIVFLMVIAALFLGIYFSRRIANPLLDLSMQAENIRQFKLDKPLAVQSRICEVDELASSMTVMQTAINRFLEIARALSAEKQMDKVLEMIVKEAQSVTGADGGGIGLVSDDGKTFAYVLIRNTESRVYFDDENMPIETVLLGQGHSGKQSLEESVIASGQTMVVNDISISSITMPLPVMKLHEKNGYTCHSMLLIPLLNRQDEVIGLLHLVNARDEGNGEITVFSEEKIAYVKALASNAALALDNNRLIRAQKDLFDSFVRLIAGAIDTKSPYTGWHCQRVPVIAGMLADAASSSKDSAFADFELSENERYELFIASWLHDCGKVTTPEYVVDKATKLETIYNRIHEIRTRFEVLWRDADISFYESLLENPDRESQLKEIRETRRQELQNDFTFIAQCNLGGESMAHDKIERLEKIARQTWQRNFENRIGLSSEEEARRDMNVKVSLPVSEALLADSDYHIFRRNDGGNPYGENLLNITMAVPEHQYNQGELYNLSIPKGTLNDEERYKINEHIVQTIEMLNKLPFPKEIKRVPDWAGNHHEKLDGSGYPRSLTADELSIPERIMAVADIFEALTASDRPYKTPKKLSFCLKIMSNMCNDGHICPDLFELLVKSGLYLEYAKKHMQAEQIDEIRVEEYFNDTA